MVKILELRLTLWSFEPINFKNNLLKAGVLIGLKRMKHLEPPFSHWKTLVREVLENMYAWSQVRTNLDTGLVGHYHLDTNQAVVWEHDHSIIYTLLGNDKDHNHHGIYNPE